MAVKTIDVGGAHRPPLVFLHEALGCIRMWKDFPDRLCQRTGLNGVVFDRQGHGRSDPMTSQRPLDYLDHESFERLPALLDELGIGQAAFFGHSDGGTIALMFAARFPGRVHSCVTEAAHVFVEHETREGIEKAVKAYRTTDLKKKLHSYHGDKTDAVFRAWADIWLAPEFMAWSIEQQIKGVTSPVLVMQGEDDEYATMEQVWRIAGNVSGTVETRLVPGCGHVPHLQAMDKTVEISSEFLVRQVEGHKVPAPDRFYP